MKKIIKKLKNTKGFTMIEIIVVLVIIAILAAATVPAMIGFVEESRGKAYAAEARVGLSAAQAAVTEIVASGRGTVDKDGNIKNLNGTPATPSKIFETDTFLNMTSDVEGASGSGDTRTRPFYRLDVNESSNRVIGIKYVNSTTRYQVDINDGVTNVTRLTAEEVANITGTGEE